MDLLLWLDNDPVSDVFFVGASDDPAIGFDVVVECNNVAFNIAAGADNAPELVGSTPIGVWVTSDGVDLCTELLTASPTRVAACQNL